MLRRATPSLVLLALGSSALGFGQATLQDEAVVIAEGYFHLGDDEAPTWTEASSLPDGTRLDLLFRVRRNQEEATLAVTQRNVNNGWTLRINGAEIGTLRILADSLDEQHTFHYVVPAGTLRDGENHFTLTPDTPADDITVGNVRLILQPFRKVLRLGRISVSVRDRDSGRPIPAKITIAAAAGPPEIHFAAGPRRAVRPGIVYTCDGQADFEVAAGSYTVFATHGFEWGLDSRSVQVEAGRSLALSLSIAREVDTTGFVAADTHVHTFTYSGHGDSTVEERMVTLAAEGVELAVATDHNHQTDYRPAQAQLGLYDFFTPVVGNEVTTENGHFNAFPLDPTREIPPYQESDWIKLVEGMRAKGAQVVILNHPRWPELETGPFGVFDLDRSSGERHAGPAFTFDAMELANATDVKEDPLFLFHDWFALLNHGERIMAVGSSDSHTVGDPVGQGRTYVRSATDDPAEIDVDAACAAFREGRGSVSMGLFADLTVQGSCEMGGTVSIRGSHFGASLRVAHPSWTRATRVLAYLNGILVEERELEPETGRPVDRVLRFQLATPPQDAHFVCVVTGPPVSGPYWKTLNPYVLAATNPVFLDTDGDGRYSSPRETAVAVLARSGSDPQRLAGALRRFDDAVAVQAASLARQRYLQEAADKLRKLTGADSPHHRALKDFLDGLPESHE